MKDFKAGKKDNEDFWIKLGDQFVLIRYFAVHNIRSFLYIKRN